MSIIKARGDWLLFDDDNVDIIKESDISRYYGDSNSGAAYVLYYQATDLDVAALGVRPPVDSPPVPTIISEADPTSSTTPLQPVLAEAVSPAMPPGLTEEPESIVVHELPPPVTPILSTTGDSPFTRSSPGHSDTKLHIPHSSPESHPSSPITPATPSASTSTFGNFFHSLRHTPSRSVRINGGLKDIPPPLPPKHLNSHDPSSHADHSQPPSLLPNLSVPVSMPNGKEREPGNHHHLHKASTWFRRKSVRAEKEKAEDKSSSSVAPSYTSTSIAERSLSLGKEKDEGRTPWFRNATRLGRRASEAEFHDPAHTSSLPHFHFSLSTPSSPFTHSHPTRTSMSSGISPPASPSIYPVPEHKKSTPDLPSTANKHMKLPERPSTAGASTGGGKRKPRPKSAANVPPLPPLPPPKDVNGTASRPKPREGRPTSPQEHRHTVHGGDTAEDHHQQQQPRHQPGPTQIHLDQQWLSEAEDKIPVVSNGNVGVSGKNRPSAELWSHPESESSHAAPILGTENSNGTSSSLSTTGGTTGGGIGRGSVSGSRTVSRSGSGMGEYHPPPPSPHHPKKKASRKLSFTAPMLGFGIKKDKDKGKEEKSHQKEHKDKRETYGNPHPPTGTASFFT